MCWKLYTLNDLPNRVCVINKTKNFTLSMFNMITQKMELETLTKNISCQCKCKFGGKNVIYKNGGIMINVNLSVKNTIYVKKIILESCYMQLQKWKTFSKYY